MSGVRNGVLGKGDKSTNEDVNLHEVTEIGISHFNNCRLPDWSPRDYRYQ